ncbi:hypothetical protein [Shewanella insulae]|uniref:hypothetical protein n=1 Tax=Shewanella insulae TaxID=2681496 RepID=UPI0024813540|nr:hypothetical protein [Shewanella insulae]
MTKYRDLLCETHDNEIGSVVGCGLDRLSRDVSSYEIGAAIAFYTNNKSQIKEFPINTRREAVKEFIANDMQVPSYIRT